MIKVLFVTSEAYPFASTGGLGEVSGSLPRAINVTGRAEVSVVLPMYLSVKQKYYADTELVYEGEVALSWRKQYIGVRKTDLGNVKYYFIDNEYYFGREMIYGNYDDGERFAYFGRAVCSMIAAGVVTPDIVHANDWQSALSVVYLKTQYPAFSDKCIFTIHNIAYQGKYDLRIASDVFGLSKEEAEILTLDGDLNLIKGAIILSDAVTTVSPGYAFELSDGFYAFGLEGTLRERKDGILGIINGLDGSYDPATDRTLPCKYSSSDLSGKEICREKLCREFCVDNLKDRPIVSMVTRLSEQKGLELVVRVAEELVRELGVILIVLGTGRREYEAFFRSVSEMMRGSVGYIDRFDNSLSRLVYSGSDMFLMPSLYEPCGISQLTALKYGTPPIVRETGGLKDTVVPYNEYTDEGTGFSFRNYDAYEMKDTIGYAVSVYKNKNRWNGIIKRAMSADFGWKNSADEYVKVYEKVMR
ncbi:MAG: glycogen synthase [Clostridia bacterium]|nr:glycogen synthase [Clostridia bacterium]